MPEMIVLVINEPEKVDEVFQVWLKLKIPGVTVLNSAGLRYQLDKYESRDDLPFIVSLQNILKSRKDPHQLLFSVVPDDFDVDTLVIETEKILGPLDEPDNGILFALPVRRAWGLRVREA